MRAAVGSINFAEFVLWACMFYIGYPFCSVMLLLFEVEVLIFQETTFYGITSCHGKLCSAKWG